MDFFETWVLYVTVLAAPELALKTRLASKSQRAICLLSAGIECMRPPLPGRNNILFFIVCEIIIVPIIDTVLHTEAHIGRWTDRHTDTHA